MSLDAKHVIAPNLEQYFVDKDTGLPVTDGYVKFFSDINRSTLKAVFTLSGTAPNYSYVQLPNPCPISGVGTLDDGSGNNVIPYYYPYDADGNIELYYIEVYNSDNVLQFIREAWPNIIPMSPDGEGSNIINFVPNGQFLAHNNIPEDTLNDIPAGEIREPITEIAPGNWTFERPNSSTATDSVTFFRYGEYVTDPTASPRYAVQVECFGSDPDDAYKDLRLAFMDVNKFASDTQEYTYAFNAVTVNSGNFTVTLNLIKNYGTGGSPSPQDIIPLTTFNITNANTLFHYAFTFFDNIGKTLGDNDDDNVKLAISFPTNISFGAQFADFQLQQGNIMIAEFPTQTDKDMLARSIVPESPPDYDGYDLFLPPVNTLNGYIPYAADIGLIYADTVAYSSSLHPIWNLMLCDGNQYYTNGYSNLGIPFRRLQQKWWNSTLSQPLFGTGKNFFSSTLSTASSSTLFLMTNQFGAATPAADGLVATGFTFTNISAASSTTQKVNGYLSTDPHHSNLPCLTAISSTPGAFSPNFAAHNSGFTITIIRAENNTTLDITTVTPTAGSSIVAGHYFTWVTFYMWFLINGVGTDPAPGGFPTGIPVNIQTTYSQIDMSLIVTFAAIGSQIDSIVFLAASSIAPGSYWTVTATNSNAYAVWYTVDGMGTAPSISNTILIPVALSGGDSAAQVASKTMIAINSTYFASPQLQGLFLRGFDPNSIWDLESGTRFGQVPGIYGNKLATTETDQLIAHTHQMFEGDGGGVVMTALEFPAAAFAVTPTSGETGGKETHSVNFAVNWITKY